MLSRHLRIVLIHFSSTFCDVCKDCQNKSVPLHINKGSTQVATYNNQPKTHNQMKTNITFKNEPITLAHVEVTFIGTLIVTFLLNDDMKNAEMYQLLMNHKATIDEWNRINRTYITVPLKEVEIQFL
jgi:hypothetical protein